MTVCAAEAFGRAEHWLTQADSQDNTVHFTIDTDNPWDMNITTSMAIPDLLTHQV